MQFSGFVSVQRAEERGKQLGVGVCHRPDKEHGSVTPRKSSWGGGWCWRLGGMGGWCHLTTASRRGSGRNISGGKEREIGWKIKRQERGRYMRTIKEIFKKITRFFFLVNSYLKFIY